MFTDIRLAAAAVFFQHRLVFSLKRVKRWINESLFWRVQTWCVPVFLSSCPSRFDHKIEAFLSPRAAFCSNQRKATASPRPAFVSRLLETLWMILFFCFSLKNSQIGIVLKAFVWKHLFHLKYHRWKSLPRARSGEKNCPPLFTRLLWFSALPSLNKVFFF